MNLFIRSARDKPKCRKLQLKSSLRTKPRLLLLWKKLKGGFTATLFLKQLCPLKNCKPTFSTSFWQRKRANNSKKCEFSDIVSLHDIITTNTIRMCLPMLSNTLKKGSCLCRCLQATAWLLTACKASLRIATAIRISSTSSLTLSKKSDSTHQRW